MRPPAAADLLQGAGLRVTTARVAVLETLRDHPHADAGEVLRLTREHAKGVSVQGVYDVLTTLSSAGLLRRIQPARSHAARFELDLGDNHHHAVCRSCQVLVDIPCSVGTVPCAEPDGPSAAGFRVDEAEVIYWGLCPRCQDEAGELPHTPASRATA